MTTFYRVHWYLPAAQIDQPGHPLYVENFGHSGRVDSPDYTVMYVATSAACAIAETFGNFRVWSPALFGEPPFLPGAVRAITEFEGAVDVLDLNNGRALHDRGLVPSRVVTRNRQITQAWAKAVYDSGIADGVQWWSYHDPDWGAVGLWAWGDLSVVNTTILTEDYFPLQDAMKYLNRRWSDDV